MTIELVTFDLDNTLWESHQVLLRATKETNSWIVEHVPEHASLSDERLKELSDTVRRERPEIAHDVSAFRVAYMERCFREVGLTATDARRYAQDAFAVFIHWRCQVDPYPDAIRLLAELSKVYQLASITNGNANVSQTSIDRYFSFNVNAENAGAAKPSVRIFHLALKLGGVKEPSRAVHVGDSLREDIEGAANAGMKTVWLDHEREPTDNVATAVVHELTDVRQAIQSIDVRSRSAYS
ncbi:MAG: HAD-IA family hydrolase [Gammaproteobacteria bacterium]|nr:HAD-IA family hydrolase [Gammaproteobacteria bacterium]